MKLKERTTLNKSLLFFYVVLMVVVPLIVLIIGMTNGMVQFSNPYLMNWWKGLFLLVSIPVYSVYAVVMVKEYFPEKNRKAFLLFIPVVVTCTIYYISSGNDLFEMLMYDSLPLYLGLNLLFFTGLIILIIQKLKGEADKLKRIIVMLFILVILFFPVFGFLIAGYELSLKYAVSDTDKLKDLLKFFTSIALVIFFHYKLLINMYRKGVL